MKQPTNHQPSNDTDPEPVRVFVKVTPQTDPEPVRVSQETNRKLRIAKQKLNIMSDMACIGDRLRGWFRRHDIE
jgi:hypothetical protein